MARPAHYLELGMVTSCQPTWPGFVGFGQTGCPDLALVLLVLWGLFIVYGTMLPFDFSAGGNLIQKRLARLWQYPLKGGSWGDVYSNVLLFVPWGLLLAIWRRGEARVTWWRSHWGFSAGHS